MYKPFLTITAIASFITSLGLTGCVNLPTGANYQDAPAPAVSQPTVDPKLITEIQQDIANWRLTSPKGNNAAEKLSTLRKLDPYNEVITDIESQITQRYIQLADKTLAKQEVPGRNTLDKALRYIKTARTVSPNSAALDKKEKQIADLININIQKQQLQQAKAQAEKEKLAALEKQQTLTQQAQEAIDSSKPPSSLSMKTSSDTVAANIPVSTEDLLIFKQSDVDNQSLTLGLELEKLSRRIVNQRADVIVHANSEEDFRWINGSLKTYVYLLDSNFHLNSSAKIGPDEHPSIELVK